MLQLAVMILRLLWKSLIESSILAEKSSEHIEPTAETTNGYFVYIWNEEALKLTGLIETSSVKHLLVLGMPPTEAKISLLHGTPVL